MPSLFDLQGFVRHLASLSGFGTPEFKARGWDAPNKGPISWCAKSCIFLSQCSMQCLEHLRTWSGGVDCFHRWRRSNKGQNMSESAVQPRFFDARRMPMRFDQNRNRQTCGIIPSMRMKPRSKKLIAASLPVTFTSSVCHALFAENGSTLNGNFSFGSACAYVVGRLNARWIQV